MKVITRQEHGFVAKALNDSTYQAPFPETTHCYKCEADARPMMVIDDNEGLVSQERGYLLPDCESGIWPHDCLAVVLYMCPKCGEITALWNQA